jgi:hypothetical protein
MFDLNSEDLWMGEPLGRKPRTKSIRRVYRQKPKTRIVYVERPRTKRRTYRPKQSQYSASDYVKGTIKGAKTAYKVTSKFVSKIGKPKTMQSRSWKDKLFRGGSIYKKE